MATISIRPTEYAKMQRDGPSLSAVPPAAPVSRRECLRWRCNAEGTALPRGLLVPSQPCRVAPAGLSGFTASITFLCRLNSKCQSLVQTLPLACCFLFPAGQVPMPPHVRDPPGSAFPQCDVWQMWVSHTSQKSRQHSLGRGGGGGASARPGSWVLQRQPQARSWKTAR